LRFELRRIEDKSLEQTDLTLDELKLGKILGNASVPKELFASMTGPGMLIVHLCCDTQYPDGDAVAHVA